MVARAARRSVVEATYSAQMDQRFHTRFRRCIQKRLQSWALLIVDLLALFLIGSLHTDQIDWRELMRCRDQNLFTSMPRLDAAPHRETNGLSIDMRCWSSICTYSATRWRECLFHWFDSSSYTMDRDLLLQQEPQLLMKGLGHLFHVSFLAPRLVLGRPQLLAFWRWLYVGRHNCTSFSNFFERERWIIFAS